MAATSSALDRRDLMLELARSDAPADRDRLLLALVNLCERNGGGGAETQALLQDVFLLLIDKVERDIRERLAEKLAAADWAPRELVLTLARDDVEIARPLIAASPVLRDHDLVRLLVETAVDHQIEIARRPNLGAQVVHAIIDQACPEVLTALAGNPTAEVGPLAMERLVTFSQSVAALRAPLARHPRLTLELGAMLYAWVGETLRQALSQRFAVEAETFHAAIASAVDEARGAPGDGVSLEADARAAMDRRVVEKLKAGGQLRPGILLRALRDGKLTLFTIALAELGGYTTDEVRLALESDAPDLLCLACAAVGVDKGALPSVLAQVRSLNRGRPGGSGAPARGVGLLSLPDRESAARTFRQRIAAV